MFTAILLIFNLVIIILLANVKFPEFPNMSKHKVYPTLTMSNSEVELSDIKIDKHRSIFENNGITKGEDNGKE